MIVLSCGLRLTRHTRRIIHILKLPVQGISSSIGDMTSSFPFRDISTALSSRSPPPHAFAPFVANSFAGVTCFSASLASNSPKLLISPALGALSLGVAASRFRYAACRAMILDAWRLLY